MRRRLAHPDERLVGDFLRQRQRARRAEDGGRDVFYASVFARAVGDAYHEGLIWTPLLAVLVESPTPLSAREALRADAWSRRYGVGARVGTEHLHGRGMRLGAWVRAQRSAPPLQRLVAAGGPVAAEGVALHAGVLSVALVREILTVAPSTREALATHPALTPRIAEPLYHSLRQSIVEANPFTPLPGDVVPTLSALGERQMPWTAAFSALVYQRVRLALSKRQVSWRCSGCAPLLRPLLRWGRLTSTDVTLLDVFFGTELPPDELVMHPEFPLYRGRALLDRFPTETAIDRALSRHPHAIRDPVIRSALVDRRVPAALANVARHHDLEPTATAALVALTEIDPQHALALLIDRHRAGVLVTVTDVLPLLQANRPSVRERALLLLVAATPSTRASDDATETGASKQRTMPNVREVSLRSHGGGAP
jgi:hypothetical protein